MSTLNGRAISGATAFIASAALTMAVHHGTWATNEAAAGAVTLTLPAATVGAKFSFYVLAAQQLRIDPAGNETIALPSTGVQGAAGKYLVADAVGEYVELLCLKAGQWEVVNFAGTWTAEA